MTSSSQPAARLLSDKLSAGEMHVLGAGWRKAWIWSQKRVVGNLYNSSSSWYCESRPQISSGKAAHVLFGAGGTAQDPSEASGDLGKTTSGLPGGECSMAVDLANVD